MRFLLQQGADRMLRDSQNKTALEYCPGIVDDEQETVGLGAPILVQFGQDERSQTVESNYNDSTEDEYSLMRLCRIL